jgi:hypothetical protein
VTAGGSLVRTLGGGGPRHLLDLVAGVALLGHGAKLALG